MIETSKGPMRIDHAANEGVVDEVADAMLLYRKRTRQQSIQNSMLTMMQMIETPAAIIVTRANANAQAVAVGTLTQSTAVSQ